MEEALKEGLKSGSAGVKATIARSVKYSGQKIDSESQEQYTELAHDLILLSTEVDPEVKKNALEGLSTIVKTNWQVVQPHLDSLIAFAFAELPLRKELIEEIKLPDDSTQKIDHGIKIRKASYNLLLALFEVGAISSDDVQKIVDAAISVGLADSSNEIIILVLHVLTILTRKSANSVI